jgi:glycosyltransferase involved in cell wall biosynthesis
MTDWSIPIDRYTVIQNWSPMEKISAKEKINTWSIKYHLEDKFCFIYTGTLGMKHNPSLLVILSKVFQDEKSVRIVVISEGPGADWLKKKKHIDNLNNLIIMPYQPYSIYPEVLGTGDVLIALLDKSAGIYSVPSKVLSYLCAKRPMLLAVPKENLAARIVNQNQAGIIYHPDDQEGFIEGARRLYKDPDLRTQFARNGRSYAERQFDIKSIGDRFERIIRSI